MILALALAIVAEPAPPPPLVAFSSSDGIARLERSKAKIDFFKLADEFEPQMNAGFCGPTTAVIVLNALRIDNDKVQKPFDKTAVPEDLLPPDRNPGRDPYVHRYTQRAFFDDKMNAVKPREIYYGKPPAPGARSDFGLQIRQLGAVLAKHGLDVQVRIVDDKLDEQKAKREIVDNLQRDGDFVIVNFSRSVLGQKGGGHISPLGAYDEKSDSFLLLDVNPIEGKRWSWVDAKALFASMRTKDHDENRGFLLVKEGAPK